MILYTPLCQEDIFNQKEDFSEHKFINYQGRLVQVLEEEDGSYNLIQLYSTNPQDYLLDQFKPGKNISK